MNKLISSEFIRLFKSNLFRFCLIFSTGLGAIMVLMRWSDIKMNQNIYAKLGPEYCTADGLIFTGSLYILFVIAVLVGLFVGTEYSNGTIRNKIIAGHVRFNIYISKLIVCTVADIIIHMSCIFAVLIFGEIFINGTTIPATKILLFSLVSISAVIALTAMFLFISMTFQSKATGSVVCLVTSIMLLFMAMTIYQKLSEPEYYDSYSYFDENTGREISYEETEKNPQYITGDTRKLYEFLDNFIPVSQLYQIMIQETKNLKIIVVYDIILIIAITGVGVVIFNRKNIN